MIKLILYHIEVVKESIVLSHSMASRPGLGLKFEGRTSGSREFRSRLKIGRRITRGWAECTDRDPMLRYSQTCPIA